MPRARVIIGFSRCPAPGASEKLDACTRFKKTSIQRRAAGTRPMSLVRVAREYQIDSDSRWRTYGSTAAQQHNSTAAPEQQPQELQHPPTV